MLEFDEKVVAKKIMAETGNSNKLSVDMAKNLKKVQEELHPYIVKWINGEPCAFEFYGITSDEIMRKEGGTFVYAVFSMNSILKDPKLAPMYKEMEFKRR